LPNTERVFFLEAVLCEDGRDGTDAFDDGDDSMDGKVCFESRGVLETVSLSAPRALVAGTSVVEIVVAGAPSETDAAMEVGGSTCPAALAGNSSAGLTAGS
jgi:hypothetical protein